MASFDFLPRQQIQDMLLKGLMKKAQSKECDSLFMLTKFPYWFSNIGEEKSMN